MGLKRKPTVKVLKSVLSTSTQPTERHIYLYSIIWEEPAGLITTLNKLPTANNHRKRV